VGNYQNGKSWIFQKGALQTTVSKKKRMKRTNKTTKICVLV